MGGVSSGAKAATRGPLGKGRMPARRHARFAAALLALAYAADAGAAERLGALPIDPAQVSVAGISSGAFMANQIHIAHSADVMGAAMIAGGLYGCAVEDISSDGVLSFAAQALGACMNVPFLLDDAKAYKRTVEKLAAKGWIDPPSNVHRAKLYLFTGASNSVVNSATIETAGSLYLALGVPAANIVFENHSGPAASAGHSWVTTNYGGACSANAFPYIDDCGYDQSGAELKAIYGPALTPPAATASGRVVAFDQTEFVADKAATANGLSNTGYLYVPTGCEAGAAEPCRLQVALHGCLQSAETLGDKFYTRIGLNEWADANRIVILYPQAHATNLSEIPPSLWLTGASALNPEGCWNWWGYSGNSQYLTKKGVQVDAIWRMIQRLEGK